MSGEEEAFSVESWRLGS